MATIRERKTQEGKTTYNVQISNAGKEISKTFCNREDAELYEKYKERLIENMKNFAMDITQRIRLEDIFDLKLDSMKLDEKDLRALNEMQTSFVRIKSNIREHKFIHELKYEDWIDCAKNMAQMIVWQGGKNNTKNPSPSTLRRIFANASSAFSHAQEQGIAVDNLPLKLLQVHLRQENMKEKNYESTRCTKKGEKNE